MISHKRFLYLIIKKIIQPTYAFSNYNYSPKAKCTLVNIYLGEFGIIFSGEFEYQEFQNNGLKQPHEGTTCRYNRPNHGF